MLLSTTSSRTVPLPSPEGCGLFRHGSTEGSRRKTPGGTQEVGGPGGASRYETQLSLCFISCFYYCFHTTTDLRTSLHLRHPTPIHHLTPTQPTAPPLRRETPNTQAAD